jgi:hypothetical protein
VTSPSSPNTPRASRRHALLFQQRLSEQVFWSSVTIIAVCSGLLIWDPDKLDPFRAYLMVTLVATALVLIATLIFRLRAYLQCRPEGLHIQLPLHHLTIPYQEIKATRPTELFRVFPPSKVWWPQRQYLGPLFGATVVVLEMETLPASRFWLRLWLPKYMLCPDRAGLVLAVPDWMALRRDLDEFKTRSRHR